ncbi:MAG: CHRD domain-containing protein [Phycisphaerales bacterium]
MIRMMRWAVCLSVVVLAAGTSHAALLSFEAFMDGISESPPNASPGTGHATAVYDDVAHTLTVSATFSDLIGTTTVAHIHAPTAAPFTSTAGVAVTPGTLPGFPAGVTGASYGPVVLDLTLAGTYTGGFLTTGGGTPAGAEALLIDSLATGKAYFNIHTSFAGGGEIRGFFVPEPGTALALMCGAPLLLRRRG